MIVWKCTNCGNTYLHKPVQCERVNDIHSQTRTPFGCDKYVLEQVVINEITSAKDAWDTFMGLLVVLTTKKNKEETYLVFTGKTASERQAEVLQAVLKELT